MLLAVGPETSVVFAIFPFEYPIALHEIIVVFSSVSMAFLVSLDSKALFEVPLPLTFKLSFIGVFVHADSNDFIVLPLT